MKYLEDLQSHICETFCLVIKKQICAKKKKALTITNSKVGEQLRSNSLNKMSETPFTYLGN